MTIFINFYPEYFVYIYFMYTCVCGIVTNYMLEMGTYVEKLYNTSFVLNLLLCIGCVMMDFFYKNQNKHKQHTLAAWLLLFTCIIPIVFSWFLLVNDYETIRHSYLFFMFYTIAPLIYSIQLLKIGIISLIADETVVMHDVS